MNGIASRTHKRVARRTALAVAVLLLFGAVSGAAQAGGAFSAPGGVMLQAGFAPYQSLSNAELRKYRGGDLVNQSLTQVSTPRETMVAVQLWDELQKSGQNSRGVTGESGGMASIPMVISSSNRISSQLQAKQYLIPIIPQKIAR